MVNVSPNIKLVTSLMNFECQPCGIFEGLSYHQEDEAIDPIIFGDIVGLGNRIKKLISSNFMGMVKGESGTSRGGSRGPGEKRSPLAMDVSAYWADYKWDGAN